MKTASKIACFMLGILVSIGASGLKAQPSPRKQIDPFNRYIPAIQLSQQTIFEAFAKVYESSGIVVSVERTLGNTKAEEDRKFTASIRGGTVSTVLNEICALDQRYAWSRDGNMVNVYPWKVVGDQNYLFNRRIPIFNLNAASEADSAAIQAVDELPGQRSQLIVLGTGGTSFNKPWTVSLKGLTLRQALNRISEHLCPSCGWQLLRGLRSEPTIMFFHKLQSDNQAEQN